MKKAKALLMAPAAAIERALNEAAAENTVLQEIERGVSAAKVFATYGVL